MNIVINLFAVIGAFSVGCAALVLTWALGVSWYDARRHRQSESLAHARKAEWDRQRAAIVNSPEVQRELRMRRHAEVVTELLAEIVERQGVQ